MINKLHLRSCGLTLFIAVYFPVFTTVTIASEDINTKDFSISACVDTSSRTVPKSPPVGSGGHWEGAVMFAQNNSSCPCFSLSKLISTKWDRCTMASLGFPRLLRRLVGNPPTEIWTINLNKLRASCECESTPAGLCTGKGERGSETYHEDMSNSEWMACTDIIKKVAEAQGLTCE
jgi:hypothetical protein